MKQPTKINFDRDDVGDTDGGNGGGGDGGGLPLIINHVYLAQLLVQKKILRMH